MTVIKNLSDIDIQWVTELKQHLSVPEDVYQILYQPVLEKIAIACQHNANKSLFAQQCQLTSAVLSLRRGLLLGNHEGTARMAFLEPRWTYAFFTAAITRQLSCYMKDILPHNGVLWLFEEPIIFSDWWDTINGNTATTIFDALKKAADKIKYPLKTELFTQSQLQATPEAQPSTPKPILSAEEKLKNLLDWLLDQKFDDKNVAAIKSHFFKLNNGLFIPKQILLDYLKYQEEPESDLEWIDSVKDHLMPAKKGHYLTYRPKDFADTKRATGIVIKLKYLTAELNALPQQNQLTVDDEINT